MNLKNLSVFVLAMVFSLTTATVQFVSAESYVGVALGVSLPHDTTDIKGTTAAGVTGTGTDVSPQDAFAYGFKAGHYFDAMPWLGVEFNFSQSDPDVEKQTATATGTAGVLGTAVGQVQVDVNSATTLGFLAMLRATEEQTKSLFNIQPYLGVGFGVNIVDLGDATTFTTAGAFNSGTNLDSDTSVGILLSAGLNYEVSENVKAYGEYKYGEASYDVTGADSVDYEFDAGGSSLMFGLAYGF
ncbi:MAG: outer membrane beta-barrel protein [Anaerolineales bacterium]|jgi:opacity protein-like surface antigen|nr:outer membrane beta-barrel protein [Anaerolineales bacterium]